MALRMASASTTDAPPNFQISRSGFFFTQSLGFELIEDSLREFSDHLSRQNLSAADLIGRAADRRKTFADMPLRTDNWRNYVPKA